MPASPNPPRVSLILLAFRQERFVAEAARAALAQDWPNLEILLSDHSSPDGTGAILERIAADYRGPHRLLFNRSASDGAIYGHFRDAVARSSGELVVMAAGDDLSLPHRVTRLVQAWRETGAALIHSRAEPIGADGRALPPPRPFAFHDAADWFPGAGLRHVHGATAAYDRRALEAVPPPPFTVFTEDLYLTAMLSLAGHRSAFVAEPLVRYRIHSGAYSSRAGAAQSLAAAEAALGARAGQTAQILRFAERLARAEAAGRADLRRLAADAAFHEAAAGWYGLSLPRRLAAIVRARRAAQRRWMVARLLGVAGLAGVKRLAGRG